MPWSVEAFRSQDFAEGAARLVAEALAGAMRLPPPRLVLLAGGRTPLPVYRRLSGMAPDHWRQDAFVFALGDERIVPRQDEARNETMVRRHFFAHLPLPYEFLPPPEAADAEEAAAAYEALLRTRFGGTRPCLVLLGIGADGHTASLFPGNAVPQGERLFVATRAPCPPTERISATPAFLASAETVFFLVTGAEKREVLSRLLAGDRSLPAGAIPFQGEVRLLVDLAALP